jgi:hypothetical protein
MTIRLLTQREEFERWDIRLANTEVIPLAVWPIAKFLLKRSGPNAPSTIRDVLFLKFHALYNAKAIVDCLENQFTCPV